MRQRLVLIGGSGFIGQSLLRFLKQGGFWKKFQTIIFDPRAPEFFKPDQYIKAGIEETEKIRRILKKGDILIHLVHTTIPADSAETPEREFKENLEPSIKLIEMLRERSCPRIAGLVYFSSGGTIYGEAKKQKPIPEDAERMPGSFYALVKLIIEDLLMMAGRLGWLNYLIIRPGNPFGPYQELLNRHGVVGKIFQAMIAGEKFVIYGKGETIRDYIYIDDLIQGLLVLIEKQKWNQVFNIGSGKGTSLKDLISLCEKVSGKKLRKKFQPIRKTDLKYNVLDCARLKALGWKPKIQLEQGLSETWRYFLDCAQAGAPAERTRK